eukprot:scaffold1659_cov371-Prasinococcus_capsulatus_cf.AAC.16
MPNTGQTGQSYNTLLQGLRFMEPGAVATDDNVAIDEQLFSSTIVTRVKYDQSVALDYVPLSSHYWGPSYLNTSIPGIHKITYRVVDTAHNVGEAVRFVRVVEGRWA